MSKHGKTLEAIFEDPVRANIAWHDVEALLKSLGAQVSEGSGSRVCVALNGVRAVFHEPHPQSEISKSSVRSVRDFLREAGFDP